MSLYVLDTDALTLLQRGHPQVQQRATAVAQTDLAITIITVEEQLTGWYSRLRRSTDPGSLAHVYEQCGEASYENSVDVYYRRQ